MADDDCIVDLELAAEDRVTAREHEQRRRAHLCEIDEYRARLRSGPALRRWGS